MRLEENGREDPAMTADLDLLSERGRRKGGSGWVVGLGVLFLAAAVGFAGYARFGNAERLTVGPMEQTDDEDDAEEESITATTAQAETTESSVASATAANDTESDAALTTTTVLSTTIVTGAPLEGVLSADTVQLSGVIPSEEVGTSFIGLVENIVGEGNVTSSFEISAGSPVPNSFRLNVTDTVLFVAGGETINAEFFPLLDEVVQFMNVDPNVTLIVEGHTDSEGDEVDNLALSQRRADAVQSYLVGQGINAFRLEARGRGDTDPVADNSTEEGRAQNRRIEFLLVGFRVDAG